MLALWAEMNLVLADEFRDGNVPAQKEPLRVARRAFQALPPTVGEYYFRGDSACWEKQLLSWLRDEQRARWAAGADHIRHQRAHDTESEEAHCPLGREPLETVSRGQPGWSANVPIC